MKDKNLPAEKTMAVRFTEAIMAEFSGAVGGSPKNFGEKQRKLAQHLFIQIDADLNYLEKKREGNKYKKDNLPITWANINMPKLAIDAMRRIELGLDALIPNHIFTIPYMNNRLKQYDIDLRIGYAGKDYYRRKMATEMPVDIIYELVYSTDKFEVIKKSFNNEVETFIFEITEPFNRGEVVGGFGYIQFKNPKKNKLVLVSEADFKKSEGKAGNDKFWGAYPIEMRMGKLIHRTTDKLTIDPDKINASYAAVEAEEKLVIDVTPSGTLPTVNPTANTKPLDIKQPKDNDPSPNNTEMTAEEKQEILDAEAAGNEVGADEPGF
jgi:recombination protein RecT